MNDDQIDRKATDYWRGYLDALEGLADHKNNLLEGISRGKDRARQGILDNEGALPTDTRAQVDQTDTPQPGATGGATANGTGERPNRKTK